jgi:hypothetical protein
MIASLVPVADPVWGMRLACLFVFAQSVHYLVWLRLVPEEARERPGIRSFASTFHALKEDLGVIVLLASFVAMGLVFVRALTSLEAARILYLRGASFHAFLEIAFVLLLSLEGKTALRGIDCRLGDVAP